MHVQFGKRSLGLQFAVFRLVYIITGSLSDSHQGLLGLYALLPAVNDLTRVLNLCIQHRQLIIGRGNGGYELCAYSLHISLLFLHGGGSRLAGILQLTEDVSLPTHRSPYRIGGFLFIDI